MFHPRLSLLVPILALAAPLHAEVTRSVRLELSADEAASRFAIENLAGAMRVTTGGGPGVTVVATVHADTQVLADGMRFARATDKHGRPTWRLQYPVSEQRRFRYPAGREGGGDHHDHWLTSLIGLGSFSGIEYDGQRVQVSRNAGVLLYADVEIQLPSKDVDGRFKSHVGSIQGQGVAGRLYFDSGSGDISVTDAKGHITADTGSGDVSLERVQGTLKCDTGSGACRVAEFDGDEIGCDTGSGQVRIGSARARRIAVDTGSGDVEIAKTDADEVKVDTGSGNVELNTSGTRLARVHADTGSGDVRLALPPDAGFEATADLGSGDIVSHFRDAEAILRRREVVGYRRGDGHIRIDVDTGSGNLVLEPAAAR